MPLVWILTHCYLFIRSIMAILVSVMGEISSGAIDLAQENLEMLVRIALTNIPTPNTNNPEETSAKDTNTFYDELIELQQKTVDEIIKELIRQITSSNIHVRHESIRLIKLIAQLKQQSIHATVHPHSEVLLETVAPRKHLKLRHYTAQSQIGML